ncbi:MAG: 2Fe-2S iron-sulfur cluster binding domain-containing protein [Methylococcales bacterium]|jgi:CDP-4-dehydro-6-deoxyglucose reductase, E3|nr:2Fe-2S iron-sulfur cluster binding domain-containing protein [Methylococcales bacterium]MBT7442827.1 2Fe-2S iron-sulfur cluster binding domain-containing protein [Methylococcales bacterium]
MTANIKILPSGHEYTSEKGESILEAGLRHGKALDYSCNNGSCGECKARLVSGQIEKSHHFDYQFSREEKRNGTVLLCCMSATEDVVLEAHESDEAQDIPHQKINAKISKIDRVTDDWVVLEVKTPRTQSLRFLAGQQVTLNFDGLPLRNKSIASCPCNGRQLHFHIHRSGGVFSDYVFNDLKRSAAITIEGPEGEFVMNDDTTAPLLFLAFDAGFAPMKSLIEHAFALELEQPLKLFWLSSEPLPYLHKECRAWADAMDNFTFEVIATPSMGDILPNMEKVVKGIKNFTDHEIYMTLPHTLIEKASKCCAGAGLAPGQLKVDRLERHL